MTSKRASRLMLLAGTFAFAPCFAQNTMGSGGGGHQPPQMDEGFRMAFDSCAQSLGIEKPSPGSHPQPQRDDSKMQALDACMKGKGYERPAGGPGNGQPGPPPGGMGMPGRSDSV